MIESQRSEPLPVGPHTTRPPMQSPPPQIDEGLAGPASATKKASSKRHSYRKRCKSGIYCDEVSLESLLRYTHLPAPAAAKELGMGITVFKKLCRLRGLQQWPYKKPSGAGARRLGRKARSAQEEEEWCSAESDDSVQSCSEEASSAALSPAHRTHPHPDCAVPQQPANLCHPPAPVLPAPPAPLTTTTVSASPACEEDESAESFDRLQLLLAAAECSAPGAAAAVKADVLALSKARSTESALTNTACRLPLWQSGRMASEDLLVPHPQTPMVHPVASVPDATSVRQLAQALATNKDLAQQLMAALDSVGVPHAPCSPNQPALPTPAAQQDWSSPFAAIGSAGTAAPPSPQAPTAPEWQQTATVAAAGRQGSSGPASPSPLAASPLAQRSAAAAAPFAISRAGSAFAPYTQLAAAALPATQPAPAPAAGSRLPPPPQTLQRWSPYATAAARARASAGSGPCRGRRALPASTAALHGLAASATAAAAGAEGAACASRQGQGQSPQIALLRALITEHQRYKARMHHLKEILLSLPSRAASGEWQPVAC